MVEMRHAPKHLSSMPQRQVQPSRSSSAVNPNLRPEELFALRRDDAQGDQLRVDEALVAGRSAAVKTTHGRPGFLGFEWARGSV